ncbi:PRC-barrel domain-containing protein [Streptomyces sp. KS 21]|uniref:PRC-barrel domain-containing protein n=1 Tax=Streptomyces sp. KS 21 TaxID=2485150 RepID=UPI0010627250|nr:PRC-barrel domain-containing protein [Streptomyces sp. KS 21]TDU78135.1 PRC-barrel domain protein [Streptomyces sp. KS 21]
MITQVQIATVLDHSVHDADGNKIGDAKHVFLDAVTGQPEWVSVKTGLFGARESFVPLREATMVEDHLEVPYAKDTVKEAPNADVDAGGALSADEEHRLYEHYGIKWEDGGQQASQPGQGRRTRADSRAVTDASTAEASLRYDDTTASGIARSGKEDVDTSAPRSGYDDTTASGIARSGKEDVDTSAPRSGYDNTTASGIARSGKEDVDTSAPRSGYDNTTASGIARGGTAPARSDSSERSEATADSEEQGRAGTEQPGTGRARLRMYVAPEER